MADAREVNATIVVAGAQVPLRITALTPRVLCLSFGDRPHGAATSYLPVPPVQESPPPGQARDGGVATASVSVAPDDAGMLVFRDAAGRALLQLAFTSLALTPEVNMRLMLPGEQHFYGMGEGGQQFDRLGVSRRLWNLQANHGQGADMAAPIVLSRAGYGLFIDNTARARIEYGDAVDGGTNLDYSAAAGPFDMYFIGGDLRAVLNDLAALLGRATMPPRWSLGYLQSTRHFKDADEITALAARLRERRLPCDAIIFLSTYGLAMGINRGVGHLAFHPELFADPAKVLGELHGRHMHSFSHEYPVLHEDSPLYAEAVARGYLLDHAYARLTPPTPDAAVFKEGQRFIDFSRADVRTWWWDAHHELVDHGISGWWLDGGEGPPPGFATAAGDTVLVHNRYDLWRHQAFAEGEARDRPNTRPFLLCRSGGPGMSRFGAIPWSGDIDCTFETMETQIRTGLSLGLSGIPHWGTDAGGFYMVAPDAGELFVRWLQFAAFCTLFRAHGHVWRKHLPWAYGDSVEAICRDTIELRYRMMPYSYTLMWQARCQGLPTMRALVLNYPDDPNVWDLGTQYLWGDDLLVAPVTRRGATHWPVYLPAGTWYDFWTQETYTGATAVTVEAPLSRLPLFVRGGAIIPFGPVMQYDGEVPIDDVTLLAYPERDSAFTLYEDDGVTNAYRSGGYAETRLECSADAQGITFRVHAATGQASVIPAGRRYTLKMRAPRAPAGVFLEGGGALAQGRNSDTGWWHDGGHFLFVRLPAGPCTARITI